MEDNVSERTHVPMPCRHRRLLANNRSCKHELRSQESAHGAMLAGQADAGSDAANALLSKQAARRGWTRGRGRGRLQTCPLTFSPDLDVFFRTIRTHTSRYCRKSKDPKNLGKTRGYRSRCILPERGRTQFRKAVLAFKKRRPGVPSTADSNQGISFNDARSR